MPGTCDHSELLSEVQEPDCMLAATVIPLLYLLVPIHNLKFGFPKSWRQVFAKRELTDAVAAAKGLLSTSLVGSHLKLVESCDAWRELCDAIVAGEGEVGHVD